MSTSSLVRAPGVPRTLALALLARIPLGAIGLLLVLQVRHLGHSYALAGVCNGACALGMAVGSPILGRMIDRVGQAPVLLSTGGAVAAAAAAFAGLPSATPWWAFIVLAAAVGVVQPPVGSCARVLWRRLLGDRGFSQLVTLDASLQELAFMLGPLLLVGVATLAGAAAAILLTGVLLGTATACFAMLSETQRLGGPAPAALPGAASGWRTGPLGVAGVRSLLAIALLMGVAFGATELGIITVADAHGASGAAGVLFALWGIGSFGGGLWWARHHGAREPVRSMLVLLLVLGVASAALAAVPGLWPLGAGLAVAGAAVAPLFGVLYGAMATVAPPATLTEAYTWETSAITGGIALGSAAAGALAGALTPSSTFLVAGAGFLLGAAVLVPRRATLR